jgi:hypothetical protein
MSIRYAAAIALALAAPAAAQEIVEPPPNHADRPAIMAAIRDRVGADTQLEFSALRLFVSAEDNVAFADVRSTSSGARPFDGWALLERRDGRWGVAIAIGNSGIDQCGLVERTYRLAVTRFEMALNRSGRRAELELFPLSFYSRYRQHIGRAPDDNCRETIYLRASADASKSG